MRSNHFYNARAFAFSQLLSLLTAQRFDVKVWRKKIDGLDYLKFVALFGERGEVACHVAGLHEM